MSTTSYCYCWEVVRADSVSFRFTDHDNDVVFGGNTFEPIQGVMTTQISKGLDLTTDDLEVQGVLTDDSITEDDIEAGLFDNASVKIWIVDWQDVTDLKLLLSGKFGNVRLGDVNFETELNSLSRKLARPVGRVYQRQCDAQLGDTRCKKDISGATFTGSSSVTSVSGLNITLSDLSAYSDGWFAFGYVQTSTGKRYGVNRHIGNVLTLWEQPFPAIEVNDTLTVVTGCNRDLSTCVTKFDNRLNFRGNGVLIPGNDALTDYAVIGSDDYNGGSLFTRDD